MLGLGSRSIKDAARYAGKIVATVVCHCVSLSRRGFGGAPGATAAYAAQLALNLAWSFIFFAGRMIGAALVNIVFLLAAISITAVLFRRIDRAAAWLLAPYGAWVAFAAVLNYALWRLN